jgi:hypothetical protein
VIGPRGGYRAGGHGELLDRALDPQAPLADRGDDRRVGVARQDLVAIAGQTCGNSPADGPAAEYQISHAASRYNTVKAMV